MTRKYNTYIEFYVHDFQAEHSHPYNRLSHFIGISTTYLIAIYGLITFNLLSVILSPLLFLTGSIIGHKIIERNDIFS